MVKRNPRKQRNETEPVPPPTVVPMLDVASLSAPPELPPDPDEPSPVGDVLMVDQARMNVLKSKGIDTTIARVRVDKFSDERSRFVRIEGEFPPDQVTVKWLRKKWGPGSYFVKGCNGGGMYLASGRVTIEAAPETAIPVAAPTMPAAGGSVAGLSFTEMLLLKLLEGRAAPPQQDDSMRDSLNAMARMIAMQTQTATMTQLRNQALVPQGNGHSDERLYALLEKIVNGAPTRRESSSPLKEFLPVLQLGLQMGVRMAGPGMKENPEPQLPPWLQIMPDMADSLGVPLIAAIAEAALPPEKAQMVIDTIREHQATRREQAKADAAAAAAETEET